MLNPEVKMFGGEGAAKRNEHAIECSPQLALHVARPLLPNGQMPGLHGECALGSPVPTKRRRSLLLPPTPGTLAGYSTRQFIESISDASPSARRHTRVKQ